MTTIRPETEADHAAIRDLTQRAFAPMPFADGNDHVLTDRFRAAGVLNMSLVAIEDGSIVGHVAVTPAAHTSGETGWFALGPISVEPARQRQGIGSQLIAAVKDWLVAQSARGCILMGDTNYYPRHGFMPSPAHAPETELAEYFMVLNLAGHIPEGAFKFHPGFYGDV
jgi:putative acetyltransferase